MSPVLNPCLRTDNQIRYRLMAWLYFGFRIFSRLIMDEKFKSFEWYPYLIIKSFGEKKTDKETISSFILKSLLRFHAAFTKGSNLWLHFQAFLCLFQLPLNFLKLNSLAVDFILIEDKKWWMTKMMKKPVSPNWFPLFFPWTVAHFASQLHLLQSWAKINSV